MARWHWLHFLNTDSHAKNRQNSSTDCPEQWFATFLVLQLFSTVVLTPQPRNYFHCYFITILLLLLIIMYVSDVRSPWKGCVTLRHGNTQVENHWPRVLQCKWKNTNDIEWCSVACGCLISVASKQGNKDVFIRNKRVYKRHRCSPVITEFPRITLEYLDPGVPFQSFRCAHMWECLEYKETVNHRGELHYSKRPE